jgi:uncharacterized glyoxalase superfamily protein PhnB
MKAVEIKAFVPAKDFELSKRFYQDIGFTMTSDGGGIACFDVGGAAFLLQDFHVPEHTANFMMHILVEDVDAWWNAIDASGVVDLYAVRLGPIELQPWRMRDFTLTDPTGVLWRIGQNVGAPA